MLAPTGAESGSPARGIRQIEAKLRKVRHPSRSRTLKAFLEDSRV